MEAICKGVESVLESLRESLRVGPNHVSGALRVPEWRFFFFFFFLCVDVKCASGAASESTERRLQAAMQAGAERTVRSPLLLVNMGLEI